MQSLNKPGGNITGMVALTVGLGLKRLEVLREMLPRQAAAGAEAQMIGALSQYPTRRRCYQQPIQVCASAARSDLDSPLSGGCG